MEGENRDAGFPLTSGQQALWFLDRTTTGASYNISAAASIAPKVDVDLFRRTFDEILRRHEALRTKFWLHGREPRQRILDQWTLDVSQSDARGMTGDDLRERLRDMSRRRFDLENELPVRLHVWQREHDSVVFFGFHHLVADFWSLSLLAEEFPRVYAELSRGHAVAFAASAVSYRDYCLRAETRLSAETSAATMAYWRSRLAAPLPRLALPADRNAGAVASGRHVPFNISAELTRSLQRTAADLRVTEFAVLLAAYFRFLRDLTGQDDIVVGVPMLGRTRADERRLIAYCVNPLPLRVREVGARAFADLCRMLNTDIRAALARQRYPFARIVSDLGIPRDASTTPVYQTLFAYQKSQSRQNRWLAALAVGDDRVAFEIAGMTLRAFPFDPDIAQFPLSLVMAEVDGRLTGNLQYSTSAFDAADAAVLADHFSDVLARALDERHERTAAKIPLVGTGPNERLADSLHRHAERVAVVATERSWTYGELQSQCMYWQRAFHAAGAKPGDRLLLQLSQGFELISATVAAILDGLVAVPVNLATPTGRRNEYLAQSRARFLVAGDEAGELPPGVTLIRAGTRVAKPQLCIDSTHAAGACVFTSGSTGRARGVLLDASNLSFLIDTAVREYGLTREDRVMQFTAPGFDVFLEELLPTLAVGARLVVKPETLRADIDEFEAFLRRECISVLNIPTAFWNAWVVQMPQRGASELPDLRLVIVGGETLRPETLQSWHERMPRAVRVLNAYGPSETTVTATLADVTHLGAGAPVPIGRPVHGMEARVLDANLEAVVDGVPGELYLTGAGVGPGYADDVIATRRRFVMLDDRRRWFRTGDRVVRSADGLLHHLGRIDRQLKLNGVRVEPEEIESRVRLVSGASRVVAIVTDGRLVTFLESARMRDPQTLRRQLADVLPAPMLPADFFVLDGFPVTAGGKPDIERMTRQYRAHCEREAATAMAVAGKDEIRATQDAVREVLGISLDPDADLFEHGLDSLLAVALAVELTQRCSEPVPVRRVFEHPTIATLAAALRFLPRDESNAQDNGPIRIPLTPAQRRIMRFAQYTSPDMKMNFRIGIELVGRLDADRFECAWRTVLSRHDVFNLHVTPDGMERGASAAVFMRREAQDDFSHGVDMDAAIESALAGIPGIAREPQLNSVLFRIADDRHVFALQVSPLLCDAASLQILMDELSATYAQPASAGETSSYADFARHVTQLPDTDAYWAERLRDCTTAPPLAIRRENARPALKTESIAVSLGAGPSERVARFLAARRDVTPAALFLLAYDALIRRYSRSTLPVGIGTAVSQRGLFGSRRTVGPFTNFAVVRADVDPGDSVDKALANVQRELLNAVEHQHTDMTAMIERVHTRGDALPVECLFLYHAAPFGAFTLDNVETRAVSMPVQPLPALLCLEVTQSDRDFELVLRFDTGVYARREIETFGAALIRFIECATAGDDRCVDTLDVLPASLSPVKQGAVKSWDEQPELLHVTFSLTARKHPLRTAIIADGCRISYGRLYQASNRVARAVFRHVKARSRDSGPLVVGILMDKSWEQVAAAVGVSRGGGVFAPIDPALPASRVLELIETAGIGLVLAAPLYRALYAWPAPLPVMTLDDAAIRNESAVPLRKRTVGVRPADPAYVMFTSGTTGDPKGVMISHAAALNTIYDINERLHAGPGDTFFGLSNFHFDLSVYDVFGAFAAGARLVLPDHERRLDPAHWEELLVRHDVSIWNSVPALYGLLLDQLRSPLPKLSRVMLSGDWISLDLPARSRQRLPGARLYSLGGATEAAIWSVIHPVEAVNSEWLSIPYGVPLANQDCRVLDADGRECPPDVPGELFIGGKGLAMGYHGNPAATEKAFIRHPRTGERLYRTGDAAKLSGNGWFEILGRLDNRVKVGGRFVDLGVVEREFESFPGIAQAAVVALDAGKGRIQLAAFVTGAQNLDVAELRRHLAQRLPGYMIPARVALLERLPLTDNGKVNRQALHDYRGTYLEARRTNAPPVTSTERSLVALWEELLETADVGIDDNFFELGGDSLLAVATVAGLRETLNVEVPVQAVLLHQTVRELAAAVDALRATAKHGTFEPASASAFLRGALPAELMQEAILDASIAVASRKRHALRPDRRRVLLTGATGYLGSRLLLELLRETGDDVFCLLRGDDPQARLRETVAGMASLSPEEQSRVTVVRGDLGKPLLGLADSDYRLLADSLDAIMHCGARVNFMLPRAALYDENVSGTAEVLRLAAHGKTKRVSYISTVSVFPTIAVKSEQVFHEHDPIDHGQAIVGGYSQSKWIAERIVHLVRERGVAVDIFRPGVIFGDTRRGDLPHDVLLVDFLKTCIRIGAIPDLDILVDIAPVDYVAAAIVALEGATTNGNYHLTNPRPVHLRDFVQVLDAAGFPLRLTEQSTWLEHAKSIPRNAGGMHALLGLLQEVDSVGGVVFGRNLQRFDCSEATRRLQATGIACPSIDAAFVGMFADALRAQGG